MRLPSLWVRFKRPHNKHTIKRGGWFQLTSLGMRTKSEIEILNGQSAIDIDGVC